MLRNIPKIGKTMLTIKVDTSAIAATLQASQRKIERCTAIALTKTAQHAQKAVIAKMPQVFDRPTPFTLRGTRVKPANYKTGRMQASVEFKTDVSKGTPAEKYLEAEVFGGRRRLKRFEVALQRIGVLPAGMMVAPGGAMRLDAFGNIPSGQIVTILRYLAAFPDSGHRTNYTAKTRERLKYKPKSGQFGFELIVVRSGEKPRRGGKALHPGIWKRTFFATSTAIQPLLMFIPSPTYRTRLPLDQIRDQAVAENFSNEFNQAFKA